ncbi:precorrin-3B synthase [Methyloferula stellata]|uniref:precorrin-3B synthase n=1 Tax=Methyloferula stellata TaxID=876270 RepID=UPI0003A64598|nr:precorrin-3B synthase [Methyloferula stellata]
MNLAPRPPTIKGWCPTALRPMETGDGLLVRLRFTGGDVTAGQCRAIGHVARAYGNGLIDLSQRGNLQLRGVSAGTLPALTATLYDFGLLDADMPGAPAVIGPPLAGLDTTASVDGKALVRALEARLAAASDLNALPDKFCFLVDEGGRLGLDNVAADIRLAGHDGHVVLALANGAGASTPVALTDRPGAIDAALALALAFLKLRGAVSARRMTDLVQAIGAAEVARAAGFALDAPLPSLALRATEAQDIIGPREGFIGVAAPFGRLHADQLDLLASLAPNGLRLTPWRCILLPGTKPEALELSERAGLIVSPEDARLAIVACPGHPSCAAAQIDTRRAAEALAPLARAFSPKGIAMHISGCSKGCASALPAQIALAGRDGAYDLIFNGRADAEPTLRGLDLARMLAALREAQAGKANP